MGHVADWGRFRRITTFPTYRLLQWDKHRAFWRTLDGVVGHVQTPLSFIELGCGSGRIAVYLASILPIERSTTFLNFYLTELLVRCRPR